MEQLIVIAVFAICAAVCVKILAVSYLMTVNAVDTRNALLAAESAAESHKAFRGDGDRIAEIMGGEVRGNTVVVYYDSNWVISCETYAAFVLQLTKSTDDALVIFADISVSRIITGDELVSFTAAVRRGAG